MEPVPGAEQLLIACRSHTDENQFEALSLLVQYYPAMAPVVLVELLAVSDVTVRWKSASLAGELPVGYKETIVPALLKAFEDTEQVVRSQALKSLVKLGYSLPAERLLSLLRDDPDWRIRSTIADVLGELNDPSFLPGLEEALQKETTAAARSHIIRSLGLFAPFAYLPELEHYLAVDSAPAVQRELFIAAYRLGDRSKLEPLLLQLEKADARASWNILLPLQYLIERRPPVFLVADSVAIRKALADFTTRLPAFSIATQPLLEALTHLENRQ